MFLKQKLTLKRIVIIVLTVLIICLSCSAIYLYLAGSRNQENFTITCPSKGFTLTSASYKINNNDYNVIGKLTSLISKMDSNTVKTIVTPQLFNLILPNPLMRNALTLKYCCNGKEMTQTILDGCNLFSIGSINCDNFTTNFINGRFIRIIGNPNYELNLCGVFIYDETGKTIFQRGNTKFIKLSEGNPFMKSAVEDSDGTYKIRANRDPGSMKSAVVGIDGTTYNINGTTYNINPNTDPNSVKTDSAAINVFKILFDNPTRNIVTSGNIQNIENLFQMNNKTFQTKIEYTAKSNGKSIEQNKGKNFVDYWQCKLESNMNISAVEIYCRSDCCIDNSTNLKLQILNETMNVVYTGNFPNQLGTKNSITDSQGQVCYVSIPIPITTTQTTIPITTQPIQTSNEDAVEPEITKPPVTTKYDCHVNDYLQDECNLNASKNCVYFDSKCFNYDELESLSNNRNVNSYYGNFLAVISKNKDDKYNLNIYNDIIKSNTRILLKCVSSTNDCNTNLITSTNAYISSNDMNLIEFYINILTIPLILDEIPTLSNNLIYITDVLGSKAFGIKTILPSDPPPKLPPPRIDTILSSSDDLTQISALQSLTKQGIRDLQESILQ